jgi:hypothetical protein
MKTGRGLRNYEGGSGFGGALAPSGRQPHEAYSLVAA